MGLNKLFPILAGAVILVASCNSEKKDTTSLAEEREFSVKVMPLQKEVITRSIEYTANLEPFQEVHMAPASPGRVNSIKVEIGSRVVKDQLLVEMDNTQLQQSMTQFQNAQSEFLRIDTLYKLGSISEQQYEQVKTQYTVARTNVEYLQENTTLKAPFNGIITGKYFEDGELYSGAPNTQAGKAAIVTITQIRPLKAVIDLPESYFPLVKKGMSASLSTDTYSDRTFSGQVSLVHPTINAGARTFQVEIRVDNPNEILRPGMFARVTLELDETEAIIVPVNAVMQQEGTNTRYVFIYENGVAKKVNVNLGKRFDDRIEIVSDELQIGADLITAGQSALIDGMQVNVSD
ncbi:MAG: efflux RND transporter periplasmic adaptor subunit [Bacteroidales bacterium]|nr:efflux RND transporter periplasmic adaptor subunit [Bacteroidales bacterium]